MSSRPSVRRLAPWILTAALGAAAACGKSGGDAPAKSGDQPAAAAKGGEARPSAADAEARAFSLIVQGYTRGKGPPARRRDPSRLQIHPPRRPDRRRSRRCRAG